MATIYIDPTVSGTGTGSLVDPFKSWSSVTWTAGNFYLQKAGTTYTGAACSPGTSGTAGNPITIGSYDPATGNQITNKSAYAIVTNSGVTNIVGVGSGRSWIVIDNIEVVGSGRAHASNSENGIGIQTTGNGNITIRRCKVRDVPGTGIYIQTGLNNYPLGWIIDDNDVYNTGSAGIHWIGSGYNWKFSNNRVHDTGYKTATFGITCYPHRYSGTITWSGAGPVYSATLANQSAENPLTYIESVWFSGATSFNLKETTGTVSSPAAGEYGFDSGTLTLYVNLNGEDPSSKAAPAISYGRMRGWIIENNEVWDTKNLSSEGNAIQADDYSGYGTIRGNKVYGRINHGITANVGHDLRFISNICFVDSGNGVRGGNGRDNIILHNLVISTSRTSPCVYFDGSNAGGTQEISNNILVGGTYGIQRGAGGGTNTARTNCIYGQVTAEATGITPSGTIATDPQLNSRYFPLNASLTAGGTSFGYSDFNNKAFSNTPTIGAIQYFPVKGTTTRTATTRTATTRTIKQRYPIKG